ncbi:homeodomain-containing protein [Onishia taeanensis]|uniref:Homeodomain-containing protein n=1 Tax=Onishia taeanensis TaxID=284577 RepID=A0A328XDL6_9GAMM|nr:homeodomain-containing protein [Halomonas taeanensis]
MARRFVQGHTIDQISEILQVRRDAVSRWLKQWETSGLDGLIDKPRSGRTPILDEHDHQRLQEMVAEQPYQIRSLQARFQEETGKTLSTVTLRRALKKKSDYAYESAILRNRYGIGGVLAATVRKRGIMALRS